MYSSKCRLFRYLAMHNHQPIMKSADKPEVVASWLSLQMLFVASLLLLHGTLHAETFNTETYRQFEAGDTLAKIKYAFPNAMMVNLNEAWVKNNESVVKMSGNGINGSLLLDFTLHGKQGVSGSQETVTYSTPEDQLVLNWVRWIPTYGVLYQTLENRYGKAEKCDVRDDTLQPYCTWDKLGVMANLDATKKVALSMDYSYTVTGWKNSPPPKLAPKMSERRKAKPKNDAAAQDSAKTSLQPALPAKDGKVVSPVAVKPAAAPPAAAKPVSEAKSVSTPQKTGGEIRPADTKPPTAKPVQAEPAVKSPEPAKIAPPAVKPQADKPLTEKAVNQ